MSKKILLTVSLILSISAIGFSLGKNVGLTRDTVYSFTDVDRAPVPKKGMKKLYKLWNSEAKYPYEARKNEIEGKVYIYFIVDSMGEIIETGILKGIGYGCDEATLDAFKMIRLKWMPGIKDGQNVKVKMVLPFVFRLK